MMTRREFGKLLFGGLIALFGFKLLKFLRLVPKDASEKDHPAKFWREGSNLAG